MKTFVVLQATNKSLAVITVRVILNTV